MRIAIFEAGSTFDLLRGIAHKVLLAVLALRSHRVVETLGAIVRTGRAFILALGMAVAFTSCRFGNERKGRGRRIRETKSYQRIFFATSKLQVSLRPVFYRRKL